MTEPQEQKPGFLEELKRRRVVRVALAYAAGAFVVLQGAQIVLEALDAPPAILRALVVAVLVGFPAVLLLGWLFDLTREGLVLSPSGGRGARLVARFKPAVLFGGAAVALVGSLAAALVVARPRDASAVVAPGADLIAVLPFTTSGGDDLKVLEQGMVDLLSRNLSEVGSLRTVDPRLVLNRWKRYARDGAVSFEEALVVARDTYAGSFLTGSVVQAGPSVRISADLFGIDGRKLAAVQVDGPAANLLALVDTVSLRLLREVWSSRQPLPRLDVSAITSSDLRAIRAFLEGFYRASRWDAALESFQDAVRADSMFALAHYRLAVAAGWSGIESRPLAQRHADAAMRLLDRLPVREQTLLRAEAHRSRGELAASADTLSAYVERYAADPEAWFFLADDLFHLRDERQGPTDQPPSAQLSLFDRALALDSAYVPALIHPLEVSFRAADPALAARYVRLIAAAPAVDSAAVEVYHAALGALRDPASPDAVGRGLSSALGAWRPGSATLAGQAGQATAFPLLRETALLPAAERREVLAGLRAPAGRPEARLMFEVGPAHVLLAVGRLNEARRTLERALPLAARAQDRTNLRRLAILPVLAGVADTTYFFASGELAPSESQRAGAALLAAIDRGDAAGVRRQAARLRAAPVQDTAVRVAALAAAEGFARYISGDREGGLNAVEDALEKPGFSAGHALEPFWFRWMERLAATPATRARGKALLSVRWQGEPVFEVLRLHALGTALMAENDAGARAAFSRFVAATADATGAGPLRARIASAQQALARLPK